MAKRKNQQKNKRRHIKQTTLIIVAEGEHDKAFLTHMKGIYDNRETGQRVKIDFSSGGSPHDIIKDSLKKVSHIAYDNKYILMDSDVTIRQQDRDLAKNKDLHILLSEPLCLEGMLLSVLKQTIPYSAKKCKDLLHPQLSGDPTESSSYSPLFDKPVLDGTDHKTIIKIRQLLANI